MADLVSIFNLEKYNYVRQGRKHKEMCSDLATRLNLDIDIEQQKARESNRR